MIEALANVPELYVMRVFLSWHAVRSLVVSVLARGPFLRAVDVPYRAADLQCGGAQLSNNLQQFQAACIKRSPDDRQAAAAIYGAQRVHDPTPVAGRHTVRIGFSSLSHEAAQPIGFEARHVAGEDQIQLTSTAQERRF